MRVPVGRIPKYITAEGLMGLQRMMLKVQARLGYGVQWFDIKQFGVGKKTQWIAWYYDIDDITLMNIEEKLGNSDNG